MIEKGEKVWGGALITGGKQLRTLVVARSQKQAAERLHAAKVGYITEYALRGYWSTTQNPAELAAARISNGKVLQEITPGRDDLITKDKP